MRRIRWCGRTSTMEQRVFGTSLGHGNETFNTNQFKELVTRGFRWA